MPETGVQNLKARYVFPVLGPPIPDGVIGISGDRIISVGKEALSGPIQDLGQVALLPGLINAHTHLEFSHLERPIGEPGISFSQWARLLVEQFRQPSPTQRNPNPAAPLWKDQPLEPDSLGAQRVGSTEVRPFGSLPSHSTDQAVPVAVGFPEHPLSGAEFALRVGIVELLRGGATSVADIAQPGFSPAFWTHLGMKAMVFLELRGPTQRRVAHALQQAQEYVEAWLAVVSGKPLPEGSRAAYCRAPSAFAPIPVTRQAEGWPASPTVGRGEQPLPHPGLPAVWPICPQERSRDVPESAEVASQAGCPPNETDQTQPGICWQLGLSPHAPYTVRPELLEAVVVLAQKHRLPLAMHLAESLEEMQFLQTGRGPLRRLLEDLGQWEPGLVQSPQRPLDYLQQLAQADRVLVIHGNYLQEEEWAFLAAHRERMVVVFCPRSHAHFGHRPYPLLQMLGWGVRVILGTDSRASAPDGNMLAELRHVATRFPSLPPQRILELATLESAQALGWGEELGALVPGRRADIVAVALPEQTGVSDPYELIFHSNQPVTAAWIAGQKVFSASADPSLPS